MKLSRQWLLISAAIIVFVTHAGALKATSLIHAKKATNATTTTTEAAGSNVDEVTGESEDNQEPAPEEYYTDLQGVKHKLTGIPQVDYVFDPNLPRELNGYNLSNYPFLENVPKDSELDIDCNKLPDGYYASIRWKCQLYHHCLSGFRANFICPNFTVFDQRTFNCLFANTVDCEKSPNFYFRNDGIYADPTTKPPPTTTTIATTTTPALPPARPSRPLRRPLRRRKPDYYYEDEEAEYDDDDYYEERARRRKQRPRLRRPIYDDDYEDERTQRRPASKSRNRGRDDDYEVEEDERKTKSRPKPRTRPSDSRRTSSQQPERRKPTDERRINEGRSQSDRKPYGQERRKPSTYADEDEDVDDLPAPPPSKKTNRPLQNDRRQQAFNRRYPTTESRRPAVQEEEELEDEVEEPVVVDNRRPVKRPLAEKAEPTLVVKPSGPGSSVFSQPRAPPIIRRPVPKNERDKYSYKPEKITPTTTAAPDVEYYDDYEDAPIEANKKASKPEDAKQQSASSYQNERRPFEPTAHETEEVMEEPLKHSRNQNTQSTEYEEDVSNERASSNKQPTYSNKYESRDTGSRYNTKDNSRKKIYTERQTFPPPRDYDSRDTSEEPTNNKQQVNKPASSFRHSPAKEEYTPTAEGSDDTELRPIVRVVKRPFLPSRGGNPNLPRGLQPVGFAKMTDIIPPTSTMSMTGAEYLERSPPIVRQTTSSYDTGPSRQVPKYKAPESDFRPSVPVQPIPKSSLDDIDENEYDVTLNDALNPTLKPLTSRGSPIGFSYYNKYDRNRFTSPQFSSPEQSYAPSEFRKMYVRAPVQVTMHTRNVFPYGFSTF